jgi:hypothetical protein
MNFLSASHGVAMIDAFYPIAASRRELSPAAFAIFTANS